MTEKAIKVKTTLPTFTLQVQHGLVGKQLALEGLSEADESRTRRQASRPGRRARKSKLLAKLIIEIRGVALTC